MGSFATVEQLGRFLNRVLTPDDYPAAQQSLDTASDAIRSLVKQDLDAVTSTAVLLNPNPSGSATIVLPPPYPVNSVASVETLGTDLVTWTLLTYQQDWNWRTDGILTRIAVPSDVTNVPIVNWPTIPQSVRVTYQHGYASIPGGLISICLSSAARQFTNPTGIVQESLGGYMVRYAPNTHGIDFTPAEERVLGYYREVSVA